MRLPLILMTAWLAVASAGCGGSDEEACKVVCDKNAECQPEAISADECASICEDLAKDDTGYADAVAARAECYSDDLTCNELVTCDFPQ